MGRIFVTRLMVEELDSRVRRGTPSELVRWSQKYEAVTSKRYNYSGRIYAEQDGLNIKNNFYTGGEGRVENL